MRRETTVRGFMDLGASTHNVGYLLVITYIYLYTKTKT